jgi:hypothetical protein
VTYASKTWMALWATVALMAIGAYWQQVKQKQKTFLESIAQLHRERTVLAERIALQAFADAQHRFTPQTNALFNSLFIAIKRNDGSKEDEMFVAVCRSEAHRAANYFNPDAWGLSSCENELSLWADRQSQKLKNKDPSYNRDILDSDRQNY